MKIYDKVIITLRCEKTRFCQDLELPSTVPMSQLMPQLMSFLLQKYPSYFFKIGNAYLFANGKRLTNSDCFATCGVWDGTFVELIIE